MAPTAAEATVPIGRLVPIDTLFPSPLNPRKRFKDEDLADLQASISRRHEVIAPLIVRPTKSGKKEIIDGARRYHCAERAKVTDVPIVEKNLTDAEALEIMLMSAVLAQALMPLEEAEAFKQLIILGKGAHTLASIGERFGKDAKWVANRIRLTELIPEVKDALTAGAIEVGHADVLAKQTPAWQKKLIALPRGFNRQEGLWEPKNRQIKFDDAPAKTKWDDYRAVSAREFESYVKTHVRFDAEHHPKAAPLEYGDTANAIEFAMARPKRGNKIVPISFERMLNMDARAKDGERTYCKESWRKVGDKPCDKMVLGVVAAGEQYGRSFDVCVNKDCTIHWAVEAARRAKSKKESAQRAQGGGSSAKKEKAESPEAKAKRELKEKQEAIRTKFNDQRDSEVVLRTVVAAAAGDKPLSLSDKAVMVAIAWEIVRGGDVRSEDGKRLDEALKLPKILGASWNLNEAALEKLSPKQLTQVIVAAILLGQSYNAKEFLAFAEGLGVDAARVAKAVDAELDKHLQAELARLEPKKAAPPAKTQPAKKAKKR